MCVRERGRESEIESVHERMGVACECVSESEKKCGRENLRDSV